MRTTLAQVRQSRLPQAIGLCGADLPGIAAMVNQAQQQLINAGGETGWWGGWQKVAFQISQARPYITLPREFARVINLDVRRFPIRMQNEFYELLEAGVGLRGFAECQDWCGALEGYERGVFPTMVDLTPANQLLRVYLTDPRDVGLRVLVGPCLDQNVNAVYSQDGANSVNGFYLTLDQPFTTSDFIVTGIGSIQKDATYGDVLLYQVDATTGEQVLLSRYAPDELNPGYRRYFINRLPCAGGTTGTVPITAMAKLEFIPANRDTDFLIIGNIPALIEECKAIRYSDMDVPNAMALESKAHGKAIKYLNQELGHYLGKLQPAVNVAPWGTAKLEDQMIGRLM
jgi:hypothetical protein